MTEIADQTLSETQTPLERLYMFLLYLGYMAERIPVSSEVRFESVLVSLDRQSPELEASEASETSETAGDQAEFQTVAQLFFTEDVLNGPELAGYRDELTASASLQFLATLPISFAGLKPERLLTGYQLLMSCSQIVPVGYFGINNDGEIYHSYALRAPDQNISVPLIIELLELISFFIDKFKPVIEAVVSSERTFEELVKELEVSLVNAAQAAVIQDQDSTE